MRGKLRELFKVYTINLLYLVNPADSPQSTDSTHCNQGKIKIWVILNMTMQNKFCSCFVGIIKSFGTNKMH